MNRNDSQHHLDANYWETRWQCGQTGWDLGQASPPLVHYLDGLQNKDTRILIPGAGRAYEAIHLHQCGFQEVYICDWADSAFQYLREQAPDFPPDHCLVSDFFHLEGQYDLILEQTFFCAIAPNLRSKYVEHAYQLLKPGGKLAGVLFASQFDKPGPPFGGSEEEYRALFTPFFQIRQMTLSRHSVEPRLGNEFFVELEKPLEARAKSL